MAGSSSSSSSFATSSQSRVPSNSQPYVSPLDSTWTPTSGASGGSAVSALSSQGSQPNSLGPLDLGPPGYEATITLYENTSREKTVYLGPWEVIGSHNRRVVWQCTYRNERLEHFVPMEDVYPHTLHARHRPYTDAADMERFLTFRVPHRIRYTGEDGTVTFDGVMQVKYEFTSVESSVRFQGDVRGKVLLDYYDVDVVWSDINSRTDRFGSVRGMGLVQRLKLWRDNYSNLHSITVFANRSSRQYHEYELYWFDAEPRSKDDRTRQMRLGVRGRRGSTSDLSRRFSFNRIRPRQRSVPGAGQGESSHAATASPGLEIKYLGLQFSHRDDYRRFQEAWAYAHSCDSEFQGIPFPQRHIELESPQILPMPAELDGRGLQPVIEPDSEDEEDDT